MVLLASVSGTLAMWVRSQTHRWFGVWVWAHVLHGPSNVLSWHLVLSTGWVGGEVDLPLTFQELAHCTTQGSPIDFSGWGWATNVLWLNSFWQVWREVHDPNAGGCWEPLHQAGHGGATWSLVSTSLLLWDNLFAHCKEVQVPKAPSDWFNTELNAIAKQERIGGISGQREELRGLESRLARDASVRQKQVGCNKWERGKKQCSRT